MKTKHITRKASSIGAIAAAVLALSGQVSADDYSHLLWAGHFKEAYSGASQQTGGSSSRSHKASRAQDALIWAGHFERAYGPASARIGVVTGPGRQDVSQHLLWAGHFKQAYQPAGEEIKATGIEVAMDRE